MVRRQRLRGDDNLVQVTLHQFGDDVAVQTLDGCSTVADKDPGYTQNILTFPERNSPLEAAECLRRREPDNGRWQ